MTRSTIELEIPEEIIEEAADIARGRNRSLESVLQDGLVMVFGTNADCEKSSDMLIDFSDDQLWDIVNRPMPWAQDSRLRELTSRSKREELAEQEYKQLEDLLATLDRKILLRSRALVLLKERGHDIDAYLNVFT